MQPNSREYLYDNGWAYEARSSFDEHPEHSHRPTYLKHVLKYLQDAGTVTTVLDAGCGNGDFSQGLASSGYKLYGIDLNTSAVEVARSRNIGAFAVSSVYDDLLDSFPIQRVDAIIAVEVIEHLYNPRLFVSRVSEALAPNGLAIITTPYWGYFKNVLVALLDRTDKALTALWDGGHIKHFSRKTLTALMQEQGFEVVGFRGCGEGIRDWTPYLWNGMLMAFRKKAIAPGARASQRNQGTSTL